MAYQDGFTYVEGPMQIRLSTTSSTATFRARNPVALSLVGRAVVEVTTSDNTWIFGIVQNDAANSIGGTMAGKCHVMIPEPGSVWATKVQTGVAASALTIGNVFDIEKSGNHFRLDTDSISSGRVVLVERDMSGSAIDSTDSSVYVQFLAEAIGPFNSHTSQRFL